MTHHETIVTATPRRIFQNAHAYHINSISVNSDAETFISADDLRINLWNLNIPDQSFSNSPFFPLLEKLLTVEDIVDIKPVNMEELTEVITAAEFHPLHCNYFAYSSSKGTIKLADMRESALCDHHAKRTTHHSPPANLTLGSF
jgi:serine/threonine-protein phosphatase 2A regulatory subunit B